ncbi:MAG TPA: PQQ-binding-like beta-propeller repeat protein [bacterium]|nr:PQQ-binding-like beta-propeller repeat protein [bacterium]
MMALIFTLAWLPLVLSGLLPGVPVELEPLPAPDEGHTLAPGADLSIVCPTPGRVFVAFGGAEPRLAALGGARSLAWVLPLAAEPTDLAAAGPNLAAAGDSGGGVYLIKGDGTVVFAGRLPGGGPVRFALAETAPTGGEKPETTLYCLGRESWAALDPADPADSAPRKFPLPATSPPAVVGGTLLYGAGDTVIAIDPEGGELWRYGTGGSLTAAPAVLGGMIYFACGDNRLYGFSPDNPAAPLVEYHELGAPPSALYALPGEGLAVGTVEGRLLFFQDGTPAGEVDLGWIPRPGAVLRGRELIIPLGWNRLAALDLAGTPFDPEGPGSGRVALDWLFIREPGLRGGATLFAPPADLKLTDEERARLAVYVAGRDGRLVVLARGHPVN